MIKKFHSLALGAMVGFGAVTFANAGASAGTLPLSPITTGQVNTVNDGVVQVAERKDRRMRSNWESRRDGRRCSQRSGNCRHFHNGYYYQTPWWTLPLIIGGSIAAQNNFDDDYGDGYGEGYGSRHVEWCSDRYRSYSPRNNTWVSYSGNVNQCNSPYG